MTGVGQAEAAEAVRHARESAAQLADVGVMLRELGEAVADPAFPAESLDQAMGGVSAGCSGALTSAVLSLAARVGQLAAVQAPSSAGVPFERVMRPPSTGGLNGMVGAVVHTSRDLAGLPHATVVIDQDGRAWQHHRIDGEPHVWKAVTWSPGRPFEVLLLDSGSLAARGRGPFLVVWRGPGD